MVPLVGKLKKFYEFSQRLGIHPPVLRLRSHSGSCEASLLRDTLFKNASEQKRGGGGGQMSLFIKGRFKVASHTHDLHI